MTHTRRPLSTSVCNSPCMVSGCPLWGSPTPPSPSRVTRRSLVTPNLSPRRLALLPATSCQCAGLLASALVKVRPHLSP